MERESIEEGLIDSSGGKCNSDGSSNVTAIVVFSTIVAACGSFVYGSGIGFSSPATSGIMSDLGLSTGEYSLFGSMLNFGGILGAILSGRVSDFIGRRRTMWFLEIFCLMGWLAIVFAKGAWCLDLGRLSLGIGIGLNTYVSAVYVAEIAPKNVRGVFTVANQLMVCGGLSIMFFIGNVIAWRTLALIGTIPCLIQVVGVFFIPESPRWLALIGREKELEVSLRRLRGENADISQEEADIIDSTKSFQQLSGSRFLELFERQYAHSLIVGIGIMILVSFGGASGVIFYASSIFKAAGCSASLGGTAMAMIQFPFAILGLLLTDISGRRPLLMVASAGTCLGSVLVGLAFVLQGLYLRKELTAALVLIGILVFYASFTLALAGTPWLIMAEIFPINIRGSGGSLATFANWFCSWIVSYVFNFLFQWSSAGAFFLFASISASTILFVAKLVPETKGRTLEEIQASMTL